MGIDAMAMRPMTVAGIASRRPCQKGCRRLVLEIIPSQIIGTETGKFWLWYSLQSMDSEDQTSLSEVPITSFRGKIDTAGMQLRLRAGFAAKSTCKFFVAGGARPVGPTGRYEG